MHQWRYDWFNAIKHFSPTTFYLAILFLLSLQSNSWVAHTITRELNELMFIWAYAVYVDVPIRMITNPLCCLCIVQLASHCKWSINFIHILFHFLLIFFVAISVCFFFLSHMTVGFFRSQCLGHGKLHMRCREYCRKEIIWSSFINRIR